MLLPVLSRSKQKAAQAKCTSNLRQSSFGTLMYIDDHKIMLAEEQTSFVLWY